VVRPPGPGHLRQPCYSTFTSFFMAISVTSIGRSPCASSRPRWSSSVSPSRGVAQGRLVGVFTASAAVSPTMATASPLFPVSLDRRAVVRLRVYLVTFALASIFELSVWLMGKMMRIALMVYGTRLMIMMLRIMWTDPVSFIASGRNPGADAIRDGLQALLCRAGACSRLAAVSLFTRLWCVIARYTATSGCRAPSLIAQRVVLRVLEHAIYPTIPNFRSRWAVKSPCSSGMDPAP
jgi:hypothetical protein